jgi:SSS family solute:Na+ symporter
MNSEIFAAFFVYFLVLLTIGLLAHKKQSSSTEFILGNRSLNFWLTALSAHASDMSAWLFMAFPAAIFLGGLSQMWAAVGLIAGMFCNWHFVAKKLRNETAKFDSYTLSTFFERRFFDSSGIIRILTALMIVIFMTSYLSAGLIAMGKLFETTFGIDYYIGLSVATLVAMTYTFSGGFITVAWTDLFQALFLLAMIILTPLVAYFSLDQGFFTISQNALDKNISLSFLPSVSGEIFIEILFLILGWGLGYFGQPHIITKFMGIKNPDEMYKSKYLGMTWQITALIAAGFVGLVGIGVFKNGLENPELVFVHMVNGLFTPFIAGIILCAVIAANMSTMDSQILVSASVLSEDLYKHLVKREASPQNLLWASRMAVIITSLMALLLAFNKNSTVLDVVFYAWSGLGCAFGPLVLMSLYVPSTNKYGAIAGIIVGGGIVAFWGSINPWITERVVPAMIPGFSLSLLSIFIISKITTIKKKIESRFASQAEAHELNSQKEKFAQRVSSGK